MQEYWRYNFYQKKIHSKIFKFFSILKKIYGKPIFLFLKKKCLKK